MLVKSSLIKASIMAKNNYKKLNPKILNFERKEIEKMKTYINDTPKIVTKLVILREPLPSL